MIINRRNIFQGLGSIGLAAGWHDKANAAIDDLATFELLNDGHTFLAVLCPMTVYINTSGHYAIGLLQFAPKVTSDWKLVFGKPENFHLLNRNGEPITPTRIWDNGHHTKKSGWIAVQFPPSDLMANDMTWLVANDAPNNGVYIDARPSSP